MKDSTSNFIQVRELKYHVRIWGDTAHPRIFMLHGWMDVSASFQFLADALRGDWCVIAPDWRGYGRTDWSDADSYWFPDYLGDLDAILRHYQNDAPVRLLGHSLGGNVASLYAGVRPERVSHLMNLEGFGLPGTKAEDAPTRYAKWLTQLEHRPGFKTYADYAELASRLMSQNARLTQEKADFLARHWGKQQGDTVVLAGDPGHKLINPTLYRIEEAMACWRKITAPVLWVGARDSFVIKGFAGKPEEYERRKACFARLTEHMVEDAGHMVHHDQPAVIARLVEDFLGDAA